MTVKKSFCFALCIIANGAISGFSIAGANNVKTLSLSDSEQSVPLTTIRVNNVVTSAILDTGSTIAVMHDHLAPSSQSNVDQSNQTRVLGLGGERFFPIRRVSTISAGPEYWSNLEVAVHMESEFPVHHTILPINLFDARVIDFDFANERVLLYDGNPLTLTGSNTSSIPYQDVNDLIFVSVEINGVSGLALIDTGADVSLVNPVFARKAGGKLDVLNQQRIQGSDLSSQTVEIFAFRRLRFGDSKITDFSIPVVDTDLFVNLGFSEQPMMVMGMDLLGQFRLQVDRQEQSVHFMRRPQYRRPESNFLKSAF